ncbi:ankyrin repeat domain-containing protein [Pedobacter arcticus]|uniref:ankyrin repeat domain-containing protein n=1 Tax=Pedobacter arcticus TaxID=752140 RepID=UPI0002E507A0|nr:ankyrin repeat domain-containing protein [Pedobacter arcticus]
MPADLLEELIINSDKEGIRKMLLENPSLINGSTSHGVSPLMLSCFFNKPDITPVLLDFVKELSLFEAASVGKFDEVAHQVYQQPDDINKFSEDGFTALGLACYFGKEEVARYLVLKGAEVNLPSKNGFNVFPLHAAVAGNFVGISKMLLENSAEVNIVQQSGLTPLHSAAQNGNIELIILLLEKGADVKIRMEGGKLASDLAKEKGYDEIADILS